MTELIKDLLKNDKKLYYYNNNIYPFVIMQLVNDNIINYYFDNFSSYTNYLIEPFKKKNIKIYFLSYGNHKFKNSIQRIKIEAERMNIFDKIYCFTEKDLDKQFLKQHGDFINKNDRGGGYWIWKPYIIKKVLDEMNENDILFYVDSGSQLNMEGLERLCEYFEIVTNSKYGSLAFELPYLEKNWTKGDLFVHFGVQSNKNITHSWQLMATSFVLRKCDHVMSMINEWNTVMSNYDLINDIPSKYSNYLGFTEHRHDQSVFSVIRKLRGSEIILDETCFPLLWDEFINYPIHAKRLRF